MQLVSKIRKRIAHRRIFGGLTDTEIAFLPRPNQKPPVHGGFEPQRSATTEPFRGPHPESVQGRAYAAGANARNEVLLREQLADVLRPKSRRK